MKRWFWIILSGAILVGIVAVYVDKQANAPIAIWKTEGSISSLKFSPDGTILASAEAISQDPQEKDYVVRLRQFPEGKVLLTLEGITKKIYSLSFANNGELIAGSDSANTVYVWKIQDDKLLFTLVGHTKPVQQVIFSTDDSTLATVSEDETMRIWDMSNGSELIVKYLTNSECIAQTTFLPNDQLLASRSWDGIIKIWHINNPSLETVIQGKSLGECRVFKKNDLAFTPDNQFLLSFDVGTEINYGRNTTLRLWRISDSQLIATFLGHKDNIESIAFSPDGKLLASASGIPSYFWHTNGDLTIRIWNTSNGELLKTFQKAHYGAILGLNFSPDGQTLVSGSVDRTIKLWDVK